MLEVGEKAGVGQFKDDSAALRTILNCTTYLLKH